MMPASMWTYFRYQVNISSALGRLHNLKLAFGIYIIKLPITLF